MKMKFKYPHCNAELETDDCYNTDFVSEIKIVNEIIGHCPECNREYLWSEEYEYSGSYDLSLIT